MKKNIKINLNKKLAMIGVLSLTSFSVLYFWGVPTIVKPQIIKNEIEKTFNKETGGKISLNKTSLTMGYDLSAYYNVEGIDITNPKGNKILTAKNVQIKIFWPSILLNKVNISSVDADKLKLNIERDKNGKFNFEDLIPTKKEKKTERVIFNKSKFLISDHDINFIDNVIEKKYRLKGKKVFVQEFTKNKKLKLELDTNLIEPQHEDKKTSLNGDLKISLPLNKNDIFKNNIKIKGSFKNIFLSDFEEYLKKYNNRNYTNFGGSVSGKLNLDFPYSKGKKENFNFDLNFNDLYVIKNKKYKVIYFPKSSKLTASGKINKNYLLLNNGTFKSNDIHAQVAGTIRNYINPKKRNVDLKLSIKDSKLNAIAKDFPKEIKIKGYPFHKILKYNIDANVYGDLDIKGYYRKPVLKGKIKYSNLTTKYTDKDAPESKGVVIFKGKDLFIDTKTYLNKNTYVNASGRINPFFAKDLDLNVDAKASALDKVHKTLLAISDIFVFELGPLPMMSLNGNGSAKLKIYGKFIAPNIDGQLDIKNGYVKYDELYYPARNVNGKLVFKGDKIYYDQIQGYVEGGYVKPSGYTIMKKDGYSDVVLRLKNINLSKGLTLINNSPLLKEVKSALLTVKDLKGNADGIIRLKGTEKDLKSNGHIDIKTGSLIYEGISERITDVKGRISFTENGATFENIIGNVADSFINLKGTVDINNNVDLLFTSERVNLDKATQLIKKSPLLILAAEGLKTIKRLDGFAKVTVKLYGKVVENDPTTLNSETSIKLTKGSIETTDFSAPVEYVGGDVDITNQGAVIKATKIKTLGLEGQFTGDVVGSGPEAQAVFDIDFGEVDVAQLKEISQRQDLPAELLELKEFTDLIINPQGKANIKLKIKGIDVISYVDLKDFTAKIAPSNIPINIKSAKFEATENKAIIEYLKGTLSRSSIDISGVIDNLKAKQPDFNLKISANLDAKDIDEFINPVLPYPIVAEGRTPLVLNVSKMKEAWAVNGNIALENDNQAYYVVNIYSPSQMRRFIRIKANGTGNFINIDMLKVEQEDGIDLLNAKGSLNFKGNKYNIINFNNLSIKTTDKTIIGVNTENRYNPTKYFANGLVNADLLINGSTITPDIKGDLYIKEFKVPLKQTIVDYVDIVFQGKNINLKNSSISIEDSNVKAAGDINISANAPITFEKLDIVSPSLNLDKIINIYTGKTETTETIEEPIKEDLALETVKPELTSEKTENEPLEKVEITQEQIEFCEPQAKTEPCQTTSALGSYCLKKEAEQDIIKQEKAEIITPDRDCSIPLPKQEQPIPSDVLSQSTSEEKEESPKPILKEEDIDKNIEEEINIEDKEDETSKIISIPSIPLIIKNGTINAKELIVKDLIIDNVAAQFSLTPEQTLIVNDISYEIVGGYGKGEIFIDLKDNSISSYLSVNEVPANAAATTLLNLPNEVYGTLSGSLRFNTKGKTEQELMDNVDGVATFEIKNGRLVRLGSLEYLLRAGNILQSGVIGLNINNLIDLVVPQKTGYFNTLTGSIYAKNGVVSADEIISKGETLSLLLRGKYVIASNYADITILGKMPKKISGRLGPLGSLSINTFTNFIPGIGFIPGEQKSEEEMFRENATALAKIPGLDIKGGKYRYFKAVIEGDIKGYTQSFQWLN